MRRTGPRPSRASAPPAPTRAGPRWCEARRTCRCGSGARRCSQGCCCCYRCCPSRPPWSRGWRAAGATCPRSCYHRLPGCHCCHRRHCRLSGPRGASCARTAAGARRALAAASAGARAGGSAARQKRLRTRRLPDGMPVPDCPRSRLLPTPPAAASSSPARASAPPCCCAPAALDASCSLLPFPDERGRCWTADRCSAAAPSVLVHARACLCVGSAACGSTGLREVSQSQNVLGQVDCDLSRRRWRLGTTSSSRDVVTTHDADEADDELLTDERASERAPG